MNMVLPDAERSIGTTKMTDEAIRQLHLRSAYTLGAYAALAWVSASNRNDEAAKEAAWRSMVWHFHVWGGMFLLSMVYSVVMVFVLALQRPPIIGTVFLLLYVAGLFLVAAAWTANVLYVKRATRTLTSASAYPYFLPRKWSRRPRSDAPAE